MDGPNLYQFLLNNPLLYVDLYGEHVGTRIWEAVCHPRVQGGLQFVGGATEAVIGGGMAYFSAGIAAPLGWVVMAHGLDHAITGFKTCVYGKFADTATTQLLEKAGMSHNLASSTDSVMSLGGSMGGIAALRMIARTSFPAFRLPNSLNTEFTITPNPLEGTKYTSKVLQQMKPNLKTGYTDFHGFPEIVDNYAGLGSRQYITGRDNIERIKISLDGAYRGIEGNFEWLIEPDMSINHRLFVPNP